MPPAMYDFRLLGRINFSQINFYMPDLACTMIDIDDQLSLLHSEQVVLHGRQQSLLALIEA
jgi:hypothetical protein